MGSDYSKIVLGFLRSLKKVFTWYRDGSLFFEGSSLFLFLRITCKWTPISYDSNFSTHPRGKEVVCRDLTILLRRCPCTRLRLPRKRRRLKCLCQKTSQRFSSKISVELNFFELKKVWVSFFLRNPFFWSVFTQFRVSRVNHDWTVSHFSLNLSSGVLVKYTKDRSPGLFRSRVPVERTLDRKPVVVLIARPPDASTGREE